MPIFEYFCAKCQTKFEKLVRSDAGEGANCPQCGSEQVEKVMSAFATGSSSAACAPRGG